MLADTAHTAPIPAARTLAVSLDPSACSANVTIGAAVITVEPDPIFGWSVVDPSADERLWRATLDAALDVAIGLGAALLTEGLRRELVGPNPPRAGEC